MANKVFNISFPQAFADEVDRAAAKGFGSRNDFLRTAAQEQIRRQKEWEFMFNEGRKIGAQGKFSSAEEATHELTLLRRASGQWFIGN